MEPSNSNQITELLRELRTGDRSAESKLIPLVYPELRRLAGRYMRRERKEHTLQPTALVHEVYLRVAGQEQNWESRAHFFAVAAQLMRHILVDHARKCRSVKRGSSARRIDLDESLIIREQDLDVILEVDQALDRLAEWDQRQADIVVFRFFGGLAMEEIAEVLDISVRTVKRDWNMARAWLHGVLAETQSKDDD